MKTRKKRVYFDHKVNLDHIEDRYDPLKKLKFVKYIVLFIGAAAATTLFLILLRFVAGM